MRGNAIPFDKTTRALASDNSLSALLTCALAAALLIAWTTWFLVAKVTVYETSRLARMEVESVAHPLTAPTSGKVTVNRLVLDASVNAGDVLVEIDSSDERLQLQEKEAELNALPRQIAFLDEEISALEAARSKELDAAVGGVSAARARVKEAAAASAFARDHAERLQTLGRTGRISVVDSLRVTAEADRLAAAREALAADVRRLEDEAKIREREKLAGIEDRKRQAARFQGQLETTRSSIARLRHEIERKAICSVVSGRIGEMRTLPPGSFVQQGEKLATVVPESSLRIVADFPAVAVLGRITAGQAARMRLDGFPWAQYGAVEARVERVASEVRDAMLRVEFTPTSDRLRSLVLQHGLSGSIEVATEQVTPAQLILRAAGQLIAGSAALAAPPVLSHSSR